MGRRLAVAGVTTALAAGALVGASTGAATAATGDNDYTCVVPSMGSQTIPMHVDVPLLDAVTSLPAGSFFDTGALDLLAGGPAITMTFTLPAVMAPLASGVTALSSPDLAMGMGPGSVPVSGLTLAGVDTATAVLTATGTNGAFSLPATGDYGITMPAAFTMVPTITGFGDVPITCTTATPATIKTMSVTPNPSTTTAKAPTSIKKGSVAKLIATVKGGFNTATGKVVFKDGTTKLGSATLSSGKAVYKAKGLKVGKHTITAVYGGDGYRTGSKSKAVVVKVVR